MNVKTLAVVVGLLVLAAVGKSEEVATPLKLKDGRVFEGWRITNETSDSVYVRHSKGMSKVAKRALPEPQRSEYPIDRELAAEERAKAASEARDRRERERAQAQARSMESGRRQSAENLANSQAAQARAGTAQQNEIKRIVFQAAKSRAERYFRYEFEPTTTNRILSFDVSIDADEPEAWAGIPGRYTVKGKGYIKFYDSKRHSGFYRATREFRVDVDVTDLHAKAVKFHLR